ncbi:hypothetical protein BCR44DRAFT_64546 [Catenaria anguillulae PL171]|uniref:MADS-box domain-containing protein n=1 Tax=Catenaria anguillulae PL171 TaxID=765915 RepID=A0A1Y2H9E0_9FUNG|nr:hypothetical protein BCR44DRAFT_64546 [Catenaria anguillulae PL171]
MGSRRTAIAPIGNSKNRRVTFAKRKQGLFKKAWEMSVLTQCEVLLVLRDVRGRLFQFAACFPTDPNAPDPAARTREPTNLVPRPHNGDVGQWIQRIATGRAGPVVETRTPFYYDKGRPNLIPSDAPANDDDEDEEDGDDVDAEDESTTAASSSTTAAASSTATATTATTAATSNDPFDLDHLLSESASASNVHDADTQVMPSIHHPAAHAALLPFQPLHRSNSGRRRTLLHMPGSTPIVSTTISRNPRRKVSIHRRASQKNKRTSAAAAASNPLMGALDMCLSPLNVDPVDLATSDAPPSNVKFNPANERAEAQLVANYYAVHGPPTTPTINATSPPPPAHNTGSGAGLGRRGTVAVRRPKRPAPASDTDADANGADAANKRVRVAPPLSPFQPNEFASTAAASDPAFLLHVPGTGPSSAAHFSGGHASPALSTLSSPGVGNTSVNGMLSPYAEGSSCSAAASGTASPFDHMLMSLSGPTPSSSSAAGSSNGVAGTGMPMVPDIFLTDSTQTSSAAFAASVHAHHSPMHLATSTPMFTGGNNMNSNNAGMSPVMLDTGNSHFSSTTPLMGPYSPGVALGNASTTPQMLPTTVAPSPFLLATAFQQQQHHQNQQYMSPMAHAASAPFVPDFSISMPATSSSSGFLSISTSSATPATHHHLSPHMPAFPTSQPSPLANATGFHVASPYLMPGVHGHQHHQQPILSPLDQALGTPLTSAAPTPIMLSVDGSAAGLAAAESASQQLAHILGPPSTDAVGVATGSGSDVFMMSAAGSGAGLSQAGGSGGLSQVIAGLAAPSDFLGVAQPMHTHTHAQGQAQDVGDADQDAAFARMWFASPTPGLGGSSAGVAAASGSSGEASEQGFAK